MGGRDETILKRSSGEAPDGPDLDTEGQLLHRPLRLEPGSQALCSLHCMVASLEEDSLQPQGTPFSQASSRHSLQQTNLSPQFGPHMGLFPQWFPLSQNPLGVTQRQETEDCLYYPHISGSCPHQLVSKTWCGSSPLTSANIHTHHATSTIDSHTWHKPITHTDSQQT